MSQERIKNAALAVKAILDERGIHNDSLDELIRDIQKYPSSEVLEQYNKLATALNESSSYSERMENARRLVAFYHQHSEELHDRAGDINRISKDIEYNERLEQAYGELDKAISNSQY